jgi:hypothetical protein
VMDGDQVGGDGAVKGMGRYGNGIVLKGEGFFSLVACWVWESCVGCCVRVDGMGWECVCVCVCVCGYACYVEVRLDWFWIVIGWVWFGSE